MVSTALRPACSSLPPLASASRASDPVRVRGSSDHPGRACASAFAAEADHGDQGLSAHCAAQGCQMYVPPPALTPPLPVPHRRRPARLVMPVPCAPPISSGCMRGGCRIRIATSSGPALAFLAAWGSGCDEGAGLRVVHALPVSGGVWEGVGPGCWQSLSQSSPFTGPPCSQPALCLLSAALCLLSACRIPHPRWH